MKKILFITGTRADFGKIKSLMNYVEGSQNFTLHVLVTGMHMMPLYGATFHEVKRQHYQNTYFIANQHMNEPMDSVLGNTIGIVAKLVNAIQPDMLVVHGDRVEALAGAMVGALNHIRVCHIEGGELSGTIDDSIRHAISKMSHIHMVANEDAKQRLIQLGENKLHIFIIGSPDLDVMISKQLPTFTQVKQHYNLPFDEYAIAMFHPVTSEEACIGDYAQNLFLALEKSGKNYIVVYPNNDSGSLQILDVIKNHQKNKRFKIYPSVRFEFFLTLLKNAKFIIGNSSAGVREAPFYGLPSINIGTRQHVRFRGKSVIDCGYDESDILQAIDKIDTLHLEQSTYFGKGNSTQLFEKFINSDELWQIPVQKVFVDLKNDNQNH
ncbi:UDP-N-acetylglucosamine 2-epimerase [Moraxella macacae 0408225]|uniref:UDP-N-acetylglucosamine 2-epimerase n=1 Tax=Moraxella macacae 0408225 TaxID=1230338 RepID=L2F888_9GAMM|nr:UDP-N-acetylglucosamine 2-epimerase [Moraxella macacae]ELA09289.1 UDP-N-acetylglucosamine 2-epimerase [Moraxella macacae 0408225]